MANPGDYLIFPNNRTSMQNNKNNLGWILIVQKLALHENGVEFCQQFNGAIRTILTASYDDVQR